MTTGTEGLTVTDWIYDTLTGDPTLMAYLGDDPMRLGEGTLPFGGGGWPVVTWTVEDAVQTNGVGLVELLTLVPFQIKAVTLGESYAPLLPIVGRLHALLAGRVGVDAGLGRILTCERVGGFQYPERAEGVEYRHLGHRYHAHAT